jgi:predicted nucleic acid-binding protein
VNYLIDTNVLSEARRPEPNQAVIEWLHEVDEDRAFISVISLAEIRRGVALMDKGRRRDALIKWLTHDLAERFAGRILAVDERVAFAWGDPLAEAKRRGAGFASMDGLLAATALVYDLTLVTRNLRDFQAFDVKLFDPWKG